MKRKTKQITISDIKNIWRIIVALVLCQGIGSGISLTIAMHHFWFMNLWIGGAVGTLPGVAFGIAWQLKSGKPVRTWIGMAGILGFLAIAITGIAFGVVLPAMQKQMQELKKVSMMSTENIQSIEIFDRHHKKLIARITDEISLAAFANGISDAVGHSPNHPRYTDSWYVVIQGTTTHEFHLHINPKFPQSIIGYIVIKSGNTTSFHGTFISKGLRTWIDDHLMAQI